MAAQPQLLNEPMQPISMSPEDVHQELREFRRDVDTKFTALHREVDDLKELTVTHVKECNARRPDFDELLKEARDQRTWREISSRKMGKVKMVLAYITGGIAGLSTAVASIVYLVGVFYG